MIPSDPITIDEVEQIAKSRLPKDVYEYFACGADEGRTLDSNRNDFDRLYILPRVLIDVSTVDTTTKLFGAQCRLPFGIAPSAMQKLAGGGEASSRGELDAARAASKHGMGYILSSNSTTALEDVIAAREEGAPPFWHQIYLTEDLEKSVPLIRRIEAAGYEALVLTVDTPVLGNRLNERKHPLVLPSGLHLASLSSKDTNAQTSTPAVKKPTLNRSLMDARTADEAATIIASSKGTLHSSSLTWTKTLPFLRSVTSLKIILKGIMSPQDALLALHHGASGIIISNHGGRQLDSAPSTLSVLPSIVAAVGGRIPVMLDGGVRRGSDVFKALALGADYVFIGRPVLWGLTMEGGVDVVIDILERELSRTMALAGTGDVRSIGKDRLGIRRGGFEVSRL